MRFHIDQTISLSHLYEIFHISTVNTTVYIIVVEPINAESINLAAD